MYQPMPARRLSRLFRALALAVLPVLALSAGMRSAAPTHAAFPGVNGKIAFTSNRDGNLEIYVMNADGSGVTRLTNNAANDTEPAWSPDGTQIAFTSSRDGNNEIYVMNADGSGLTRLTTHAATDNEPAWSPDGTQIAFTSGRIGVTEVFVMAAGGGTPTNLTNSPGFDSEPAWSPDGTRIAFTTTRDSGNSEVYAMNADGSGLTRLTNNTAFDAEPAWSPDGTQIAFTSVRDLNFEIYVMNADGSGPTRLAANPATDHEPAWSPDGMKIAFASLRATGSNEVYVMNADGSGVTRLTSNPASFEPDWQRPTGTIAIVKSAAPADDRPFGFTEDIRGTGFVLSDPTLPSVTFEDVPAGGYLVAEINIDGWVLSAITCNDPSGNSSGDTGTGVASIDLAGDETVTCAFSNSMCPAGTYDNGTICTGADPGYFVPDPGLSYQTPCSLGYYQPAGGATACVAADPGHFVGATASTSQSDCALGTYQPDVGQSSCLDAAPGHYVSTTAAIAQSDCGLGTYQPGTGQTGCLTADAGYYVDTIAASAQTPCPPGTTSPPGSTSVAACVALPVASAIYVSADGGTIAGGPTYQKNDILRWDGTAWSVWFDGATAGLKATGGGAHPINALWIPDPTGDDVVLGFTTNGRVVPGVTGKVDATDLVWWNGTTFSLYFDGQDVGLTKSAESIDALHALAGGLAPPAVIAAGGGSCARYLLISTVGRGTVPNYDGTVLNFNGEDVLGFCLIQGGSTTTGRWHKLLDGSDQGMPPNSTTGLSFSDDGQTMYLTTAGAFNVDGSSGNHSMVYKFDFSTQMFSGPFFKAADEGLSQTVLGLQVSGELP